MNKNVNKIQLVIAIFSIVCMITACGQDAELEAYKSNMSAFFDSIATYDSEINAIDPAADDAPEQLLEQIDALNNAFTQMAEYPVPSQFQAAESLADEAADYMNKADAAYHMAYDGEYDPISESEASQFYERAFVRVQYIVSILHGNVPSGEGVSVTVQDAGQIEPVDDISQP